MIVAVYLPLLFCAGLAVAAVRAARRLPPGLGLWAFTAAAVVGAISTVWSLVLLASVLADELPSYDYAEASVPVPDLVSAVAAILLTVVCVRTVNVVRGHLRERQTLRALTGTAGDLTIVDDLRADAFAVADGEGGTIVITTGMLRLLRPEQQEALVAHERAHLRHHHAAARIAVRLAAAANPILIPVRDEVAFLCERHADECAAAATGDRRMVARTIAAAALARTPAPVLGSAPALHRLAVTDRVRALTAQPVRRRVHLWPLAAGPCWWWRSWTPPSTTRRSSRSSWAKPRPQRHPTASGTPSATARSPRRRGSLDRLISVSSCVLIAFLPRQAAPSDRELVLPPGSAATAERLGEVGATAPRRSRIRPPFYIVVRHIVAI